MELIKRNIHMDRKKTEAVTQLTLEEDVNVPDSKPDINTLNLEKGDVVVEEIKPGTDSVYVKGFLHFCVLYHTTEESCALVALDGKLPFEEKIYLKNATSLDTVRVETEVDDLTVGLINSRKLNLQSLITLKASVEELFDEEVPVAIHGEESAQYRKMPVEIAQLSVCKNDIFRIKQEFVLPSNYPNIFQLLWDSISLEDVEFKVQDNKLALSGDVHIFALYEGEGEEHPIRGFENTMPFNGMIDCQGCKEGMIPDIQYRLGQKELTIRPDFDGEERNLGLDLVLDCEIKIYEEETVEIISDVYGVSNEIEAVTHEAQLRDLLTRMTGKTKLSGHMKVRNGNVLSLLHSEGRIMTDRKMVVENGIQLQGSLEVKVMYITGEDATPYGCAVEQIPYQYTLEIPEIAMGECEGIHAELEQLQVTMLDGEEMDVKAVICFSTVVFKKITQNVIEKITVSALDTAFLASLPGMAIYVVKTGDNLWNIGKKYYVPVDSIRKMNDLENDELFAGQKLLIVKQGSVI